MANEKIIIKVLIEGNQVFTDEYNRNQKLQVIVNRTVERLASSAENRELRREDGTPLTDLSLRIDETTIRDGETLRFFKKAGKPDRDKGFA